MSFREIIKLFPQYRIFKSLSFPKRYFAVLNIDVEKMKILKNEYSIKDQLIPDCFKVKALPLITTDNDFYEVFDHHPTLHIMNDLNEDGLIKEDAITD